eukprot:5964294-Amphidinium_carterae.2
MLISHGVPRSTGKGPLMQCGPRMTGRPRRRKVTSTLTTPGNVGSLPVVVMGKPLIRGPPSCDHHDRQARRMGQGYRIPHPTH